MKIAFITSCAEAWGGSEELWAGAAEKLRGQGAHVTALRTRPLKSSHHRVQQLRDAGITLKDFQPSLWMQVALKMLRQLHRQKPALRRFTKYVPFQSLLRASGAELAVISQGETYDGICGFINLAEVCENLKIPYVLVCQKSFEDKWPSDDERTQIKRAFNQAHRAFFVSEHNRLCTQNQLASPLPNSEVIRNPYMINTDQSLPWPTVDGGGPIRLACVARLSAREKGQDLLLNVLAQSRWRRRGVVVNFFGTGGEPQGLQEMAGMLGLHNVHFQGFTDDVTQVWREHHALVLPSRQEGLPLALVEAMMCGRCGIVTNVGGSAEMVSDNVTGFVAAAPSVEALSEAMERAWNRRREWRQIGLDAAQEVRQRVGKDPCGIFAEKLVSIHQEICREKACETPKHSRHHSRLDSANTPSFVDRFISSR